MEYQEAKDKFISAWGSLGSSWGINRTMAQIHALLLVAIEPMSADEIMEELKISRGNANMNIRSLVDWGLVEKEFKPGERREYFAADKDIWEVAKQIAKERKRRELEPVQKVLQQVKNVKSGDKKSQEFKRMTSELSDFADQAETMMELFVSSKKNWIYKVIGMFKKG